MAGLETEFPGTCQTKAVANSASQSGLAACSLWTWQGNMSDSQAMEAVRLPLGKTLTFPIPSAKLAPLLSCGFCVKITPRHQCTASPMPAVGNGAGACGRRCELTRQEIKGSGPCTLQVSAVKAIQCGVMRRCFTPLYTQLEDARST